MFLRFPMDLQPQESTSKSYVDVTQRIEIPLTTHVGSLPEQ